MVIQADLYNLVNIQPLQLNTSYLNNTTTLVTNIFGITYSQVGDMWFIVSIWAIFIFFNWLFYRRQEGFGYDISRSLLLSSGFCFFISVGVLLSGWIYTILPVIWFSELIFISYIMVYSLKQKNL